MNRDQKNTIKAMAEAELGKRLQEISDQLIQDQMQLMVGKLKNLRHMKTLRHERAVIKTIQAERALIAQAVK